MEWDFSHCSFLYISFLSFYTTHLLQPCDTFIINTLFPLLHVVYDVNNAAFLNK